MSLVLLEVASPSGAPSLPTATATTEALAWEAPGHTQPLTLFLAPRSCDAFLTSARRCRVSSCGTPVVWSCFFLPGSPPRGGCGSQYWNCLADIHSPPYHLSQCRHSLKDNTKHHLHPTFFKSLADSVTHQEIPVRRRTQGAHAILLIETENKLSQ